MTTTPPAPRRRVLFVEDEAALRSAYQRYFAQRFEMAFASTGAEGLARFKEYEPDVLVLDMQLPDTDGLDLLRAVRAYRPAVLVVVTTAYASMQPLLEMLGLRHSGFLVKPFELADLGATIEAAK
jgi:DNA-binding response OmpR family regulator